MGYIFWLVLTIIFTVIEFAIPSLVTIWFAIGTAATVFISLVVDNQNIEIVCFTLISIVALLFIRPYAKKAFSKRKENFDAAAIDTDIIVEKIIDTSKEEKIYDVKYKGSVWTGLSKEIFEVGDRANIKSFKGNKIILTK